MRHALSGLEPLELSQITLTGCCLCSGSESLQARLQDGGAEREPGREGLSSGDHRNNGTGPEQVSSKVEAGTRGHRKAGNNSLETKD